MRRLLMRALDLVPRRDLWLAEERLRIVQEQLETTIKQREHEAAQAREVAARASRRIAALEEKLRDREAQIAAASQGESALEAQVATALEKVELARGNLLALEVKLDILEGAANVLDRRLRAARPHSADVAG